MTPSKLIISHWETQRDQTFRKSIYGGEVIRLPKNNAATRLIEFCRTRLSETFGLNFREIASQIPGDQFFTKIGVLRREFYESDHCRAAISELVEYVGADAADHVCDPVRLRAVSPGGHLIPAAAPVYYGHRDTWYSNPQTQITWWFPLHDVTEQETFEFLPSCFELAVSNDSQSFDYGRWTSDGTKLKIGWQDQKAGQREHYPRLLDKLPNQPRERFSAKLGEGIVFSGQHLHQTVPIHDGLTRFSIDFRTVHLNDHNNKLGPKNVDNCSTGDALNGHLPLARRPITID